MSGIREVSEKSERLRRRPQITVWQSGWSAGKQLQSLSLDNGSG